MRPGRGCVWLSLVFAALLGIHGRSAALTPAEVLVVANRNAAGSVALAVHYLESRGIPSGNLLKLWAKDGETCSRREYETRIAAPVRARLEGPEGNGFHAVVLMYGVPLRVLPPEPSLEEKRVLGRLEEEAKDLAERLKGEGGAAFEKRLETVRAEIRRLRRSDQEAAVDSELALVRTAPYPLDGWVPNPLFVGFRDRELPTPRERVLVVSRLDGPSEAVVRRVIGDSLEAEARGVDGGVYLDARWPAPEEGKEVSGYALYDRSLHQAATALRAQGFPVVLEQTGELFPEGARLPAALYCGWYRLARYVDAFAWAKGAVGYHIASAEATTLKTPGSTVWCKRMLEEGVAATLGPVGEPYVQAFPLPHVFFSLLTDRRLTLGEAYLLSLPYLSWKMVLIGDPLYRPRFTKTLVPEAPATLR